MARALPMLGAMNFPRKHTVLLTSLFLIIGCSDDGNQNTPTGGSGGSGGGSGGSGGGSSIQIERPENAIEGQYIFVLDDKAVTPDMVSSVAQTLIAPHSGTLLNVYDGAMMGFSANNLDDNKALAIAKDPRVIAIGQDGTVQVDGIQTGATWGLDRIDSKTLTLDTKYEYAAT